MENPLVVFPATHLNTFSLTQQPFNYLIYLPEDISTDSLVIMTLIGDDCIRVPRRVFTLFILNI